MNIDTRPTILSSVERAELRGALSGFGDFVALMQGVQGYFPLLDGVSITGWVCVNTGEITPRERWRELLPVARGGQIAMILD